MRLVIVLLPSLLVHDGKDQIVDIHGLVYDERAENGLETQESHVLCCLQTRWEVPVERFGVDYHAFLR